VNHSLGDACQRPQDRLRVETAGDERLAHAAQPRRGRFGADVAVLVPPQEASGKIVRIAAATAEPLQEEGCRLSAVEVRKRHAPQFVLLDAEVEVLDQRRPAVAAAHHFPEIRAGIRDQRFPAMAQFLVNRDGHGPNPQTITCGQSTRRRCRFNARGVSVTLHAHSLQRRLPDRVLALGRDFGVVNPDGSPSMPRQLARRSLRSRLISARSAHKINSCSTIACRA